MDGDASGKTLDKAAVNTMPTTDQSVGIFEASGGMTGAPVGEKTTGTGTSFFDKDGAVGKQFTAGGALGGTAQKVGGPFSADGAVGKQFTEKGAIGGSVQNALGGKGETDNIHK